MHFGLEFGVWTVVVILTLLHLPIEAATNCSGTDGSSVCGLPEAPCCKRTGKCQDKKLCDCFTLCPAGKPCCPATSDCQLAEDCTRKCPDACKQRDLECCPTTNECLLPGQCKCKTDKECNAATSDAGLICCGQPSGVCIPKSTECRCPEKCPQRETCCRGSNSAYDCQSIDKCQSATSSKSAGLPG